MWVSVVFLVIFTALWFMTSLWLRNRDFSQAQEPVHHAAPRGGTVWGSQARA
ncbi:hypothetical protein [Streptomyces sp. NPDC053367]|uniref:hypothetical protein n=1 Tax=Streptomyces sp. NPDC053367 TaxID=3365700 RepID=UPI0037CE0E59